MALVDVEYEVYKCPHCSGYIIIRKQFPYLDCGCSTSVKHSDSPEPESGEDLEERC